MGLREFRLADGEARRQATQEHALCARLESSVALPSVTWLAAPRSA
jgi:hypothetical protein